MREVRERVRFHFLHHARAMNLHVQALGQVQVARDDLVGLAGHDQVEHFALARRERLESLPDHVALGEHATAAHLFQRLVDAVQQVLVAERLLDEIDGARLHCLDGHRHVAVSRDEDDRQDRVTLVELHLQLQAAHAGHADVEYEAAGTIVALGIEEFLARFEHLHRQADGLEQHPQRSRTAASSSTTNTVGLISLITRNYSCLGAGETGSVKWKVHPSARSECATADRRGAHDGTADHEAQPGAPDLVVKNGLNRCSVASATRPVPWSATTTRSRPRAAGARAQHHLALGFRHFVHCVDRIGDQVGARPAATDWIGVHAVGRSGSSSIRSRTLCSRASVSASVRRSSSSRLQSTGSRLTSRFLTKLRSRRMTSPARSACTLICSSASSTSASSRFGARMKRWQACAYIVIADSGWLISCARPRPSRPWSRGGSA